MAEHPHKDANRCLKKVTSNFKKLKWNVVRTTTGSIARCFALGPNFSSLSRSLSRSLSEGVQKGSLSEIVRNRINYYRLPLMLLPYMCLQVQ